MTHGRVRSDLVYVSPYCKTKTGQCALEEGHYELDVKTTLLHLEQPNTKTVKRCDELFISVSGILQRLFLC